MTRSLKMGSLLFWGCWFLSFVSSIPSGAALTDPYTVVPPECPSDTKLKLHYPSATFSYMLISLAALICAVIVALNYNSVVVLNRKIRSQNISNTLWILYYAIVFARSTIATVRYGLDPANAKAAMDVATLSLTGVGALFLCCALNHQRKWRSPDSPQTIQQVFLQAQTRAARENDPILPSSQKKPKSRLIEILTRHFGLPELLFVVFFLVFVAGVTFYELNPTGEHQAFGFYFLIAGWALIEIPAVVLVCIITFQRNTSDGPSKKSKGLLVLGEILNFTNDLPLPFWTELLQAADATTQCVFIVASWVDFINILFVGSLICFFFFIRSEYLRNMEECILTTLSQIQDTFAYRGF